MVPYFTKWKCSNQWANAQGKGSRICRRIENLGISSFWGMARKMEKEVKSTFLYISNWILKTLQKFAEFFLEGNYKLFFGEKQLTWNFYSKSDNSICSLSRQSYVTMMVFVKLQETENCGKLEKIKNHLRWEGSYFSCKRDKQWRRH